MTNGKYITGVMVLALFVTGLLVVAPSAQAVTFDLTSNHITNGGFGKSPFGDVVLTQNGGAVDITVNLFNGNKFINTGAGASQNFLFNATGITWNNVTQTGDLTALGSPALTFTGSSGSAGLHADGTGYFDFGVVVTGQGTGGGAGNQFAGPLTFEVANAVISDFTANVAGNFFAADIILGGTITGPNGASAGFTGLVDASGPTKVPEPTTMLLLGLGLVGLAGVRRMLKN